MQTEEVSEQGYADIILRRSQAAEFIEKIRRIASRVHVAVEANDAVAAKKAVIDCSAELIAAFEKANIPPLDPCDGEAHSNAHIDNCGQCAPRWGWLGGKVVVR